SPHLSEAAGAQEGDHPFTRLVEHDILAARGAVGFEAEIADPWQARGHEVETAPLEGEAPARLDRSLTQPLLPKRLLEGGDAGLHVEQLADFWLVEKDRGHGQTPFPQER